MGNARNLGSLLNTNTQIAADDLNVGQLSNRNMVINGAMQVAQRGTSFTTVANSSYNCDRWISEHTSAAFALDFEQVAGPAALGFVYANKATVRSTATASASQYIIPFEQRMEKSTVDRFQVGIPLTLSFWIKSNRTGTYTVDIKINGPAGGTDDSISRQYTITSANTWEYKTITFPANPTTYSDVSYTASAVTLFWWMIAGSTYTSGSIQSSWSAQTAANRAVGCSSSTTSGDNWSLTGVQLEAGTVATPFEHRPYGDELTRCQRYYWRANIYSGYRYAQNIAVGPKQWPVYFSLPVSMRSTPSGTATFTNFDAARDGGLQVLTNAHGMLSMTSSYGGEYASCAWDVAADAEL